MNHLVDKDWLKSGPHPTGFGDDEVTVYSKHFANEFKIVIEEHENYWGGKTEAHLHNFKEPSSSRNHVILPSISIWCTGATTDQIVNYLLEAKKKLADHKLIVRIWCIGSSTDPELIRKELYRNSFQITSLDSGSTFKVHRVVEAWPDNTFVILHGEWNDEPGLTIDDNFNLTSDRLIFSWQYEDPTF